MSYDPAFAVRYADNAKYGDECPECGGTGESGEWDEGCLLCGGNGTLGPLYDEAVADRGSE